MAGLLPSAGDLIGIRRSRGPWYPHRSQDGRQLDRLCPLGDALIRYLVSAVVALLTLFATLLFLSRTVGPGSPGEILIVGQLELLADRLAEGPVEPEPARRPPERPKLEPGSP